MNMGLGLDVADVYLPDEPVSLAVTPEDPGARLTAVMQDVIRRAAEYGTAFATVQNSRHYGMAQYYPLMALPQYRRAVGTCTPAGPSPCAKRASLHSLISASRS